MLYSEAAGTSHWTAPAPSAVLGRPACAALPVALNQSRPTLSFGCTGMRTFTDISENRLLGVVRGDQLQEFVAAVEAARASNQAMQSFYDTHRARFVS
jgi:uncharacterized protein (DUF169 family)